MAGEDLTRRLQTGADVPARYGVTVNPSGVDKTYAPFAHDGQDATHFKGVSPEYRTYADNRSKPLNPAAPVGLALSVEAQPDESSVGHSSERSVVVETDEDDKVGLKPGEQESDVGASADALQKAQAKNDKPPAPPRPRTVRRDEADKS
jgi:hypothetical protein